MQHLNPAYYLCRVLYQYSTLNECANEKSKRQENKTAEESKLYNTNLCSDNTVATIELWTIHMHGPTLALCTASLSA